MTTEAAEPKQMGRPKGTHKYKNPITGEPEAKKRRPVAMTDRAWAYYKEVIGGDAGVEVASRQAFKAVQAEMASAASAGVQVFGLAP